MRTPPCLCPGHRSGETRDHPGLMLGRDGVLQDQRVTGDDRDHHADWLVFGGVAGPDVLGDGRPGGDAEPGRLVRRGHAGDDFVDVVDLLVAGFLEDVLAGGVFGFGQFGAPDDLLVEVVVGDDRGLAVDVAHVPADYYRVGARVQVQPGCDAGWRGDLFDVEVLPGRVVALALDVGFPGVRRRRAGAVGPLGFG